MTKADEMLEVERTRATIALAAEILPHLVSPEMLVQDHAVAIRQAIDISNEFISTAEAMMENLRAKNNEKTAAN